MADRRFAIGMVAVGLLIPMQCGSGKTGSLANGTKITHSHRGSWSAPGGKNCRWTKTNVNRNGVSFVVAEGSGNKKQTVLIYSADKGGRFNTVNCGAWK